MENVIAVMAAVIAALAATASAAFATRQIKYQARQTEQANSLTATSELRGVFDSLHRVHGYLIEYPYLRACFYDGDDGHQLDEDSRIRLMTIAEMFADVLDDGLFTSKLHPATLSYEQWIDYALEILRQSPALRKCVSAHPFWWLELEPLWREHSASTADN
jgi:hypothetical protein